MELYSRMAKTFGRGVFIDRWSIQFQSDSWYLQEWIWDRPEFQKRGYTEHIHNLAIF